MTLPTSIEDIISALQRDLLQLSRIYPDIPRVNPDSIYGPETTAAVRAFQKRTGLPQSGTVNEATMRMLYEIRRETAYRFRPSAPLYPFEQPLRDDQISPQDYTDLVMLVQIMLNTVDIAHNFGQIPISGQYDEETAKRIHLFQERSQLPTTGILDRLTWETLARAYNTSLNRE